MGLRLKVYGIAFERPCPSPALVEAARRAAASHLETHPTRHDTHGAGFLGVHEGRTGNQAFLEVWINSNELMHRTFASSSDEDALLSPTPADFNSVCVWDLALQWFEREAWVRHMLRNPAGPQLDGYLAARLNADLQTRSWLWSRANDGRLESLRPFWLKHVRTTSAAPGIGCPAFLWITPITNPATTHGCYNSKPKHQRSSRAWHHELAEDLGVSLLQFGHGQSATDGRAIDRE